MKTRMINDQQNKGRKRKKMINLSVYEMYKLWCKQGVLQHLSIDCNVDDVHHTINCKVDDVNHMIKCKVDDNKKR